MSRAEYVYTAGVSWGMVTHKSDMIYDTLQYSSFGVNVCNRGSLARETTTEVLPVESNPSLVPRPPFNTSLEEGLGTRLVQP